MVALSDRFCHFSHLTKFARLCPAQFPREVAEALFDETDADWSGELELAEFRKAFRRPDFLRRVAAATGADAAALEGMSEADVDGLFRDLDRDSSGAISFDEFARNLAPLMRQQGHAKVDIIRLETEEVDADGTG